MFGVAGVILFLALSIYGTVFVSMAESQSFQNTPIILRASEVLPMELLSGPNYTVRETVRNDGMVNIYEMDTPYGPLKVESTALLMKRISELKALAKIEELKGTEVYMKAFKQAAISPVKTAVEVIENPVGSVSGVASGIGRFFSNVSSSITGSSPYKDSIANSVLGQASYKREFAYQFGVDPYTSYEPLQKALKDLAWTAAAGGLTVKAAVMAIPGGAGMVIGLTGTAGSMKALVRDKTPNELEKINQNTLSNMGVPDSIIQAFMQNTSFDPYEQTLLVGELANMIGVMDRKVFIETAIMASMESVAVFLRTRAQLMGHYYEKTKDVSRFVDADGVPLLLTKSGMIVGIFPLDHVAWTAAFGQKAMTVSGAIREMPGIRGKELWITGTVDPVARKTLEDRGWKVEEKIETRLLK